jgi:hypothetical protein
VNGDGNATSGDAAALAREVKEDGAACPPDAGPCIVVGGDDNVIGFVCSPEGLVSLAGRQGNLPVVAAITRVFAPGINRLADADRQSGYEPGQAIGAEVYATEVPDTHGRRTITFALEMGSAIAAQQAGYGCLTERQATGRR